MHPILRNFLAVVAGMILGSIVNMGIILVSNNIIPLPAGVVTTDQESLKAMMHLFSPKHFIMPFLAHAFGTFAGAFVAALLAVKNKMRSALIIGFLFMSGGISEIVMLPSPLWFSLTDALGAYLPMAYLAAVLVEHKIQKRSIGS